MDRAEKQELVASLQETLKSAEVVVVAHYAGLTVAEMTELRRQMREAGASVQVAKNRLVKLALQGTDAEPIADLFKGQTLVATSGDPVAAPKVASEFAKKNEKLVILGGAMGTTILDTAGVNALATMPSLDELRGKIVGLLQAPATKIAQVLQAPGGQLARVFGAYAKKDEAA
ncbi:50S ribosomal protein L10 [uncultured Cohaesibacter sp.]|uniref:50S ribosomal protein L10 n=1 Tax=uncultured Cohaesibacter sp. TaxID=1002546 RepID=UPI0029C894DA|nr:50S ribosomal protein L10 [uncultured Cohaesibacter sp.]